jgi:trehalose-6-phosphate synthase
MKMDCEAERLQLRKREAQRVLLIHDFKGEEGNRLFNDLVNILDKDELKETLKTALKMKKKTEDFLNETLKKSAIPLRLDI